MKRTYFQRICAFLLSIFLFAGSLATVNAAEETTEETPQNVMIEAVLENVTANFDKEQYAVGDTATVRLIPAEGYHIRESAIRIMEEDIELPYEKVQEEDGISLSFAVSEKKILLYASADKTYKITYSCKDMDGKETEQLFVLSAQPEVLLEGSEVTVSVNYKGVIGWAARVSTVSGGISCEMTSDSLKFTMPAEDVLIEIEEMEVYNKGDLSAEDSELGEDIGKDHQITTGKTYEPDVSLGKAAKWDDIEEGTATLTLTQKDTSNWSDNPADYIIVLDRTVSMAVDYTSVCGSPQDDLGFGSSVCLNPDHFYMYQGKAVKLIDYGHGFFISSGTYFSTESYMGSEEALWKAHYDSNGKRIDPRVKNGCTDRLTIAQNSIKDILDVLDAQNKNQLAGGKKNRVMYWSFSGSNQWNNGTWNEMAEFTEDMSAVKKAIKYESYPGTYYYRSFEQILKKLENKKKDPEYQDIPTKVIFISDGMLYDKNTEEISALAKKVRETANTKLYTILIGNSKDSEAGKVLKSYATSPSHFATVTSNWDVFVDTITAIQKDQFEIRATEKVVTDRIAVDYWEVVGDPIVESGNGTASLDKEKQTLTWKIPEGSGKTYTCKVKLKLKDAYRYLLSDTSYPTNADAAGADEAQILKDPSKAGGIITYQISGGKYNGETRQAGIITPTLKYGTLQFSGTKKWTVAGSYAAQVKLQLKRTMPGSSVTSEINNTVTNITKQWKYGFTVRQMPDGTTYPLIKYNNAGEEIRYEVTETAPDHYVQTDQKTVQKNGILQTDFYNEPFKRKVQIKKVDEETKNPLSGAQFTVYAWSEKKQEYVPYHGTADSMDGAEAAMMLTETEKGIYRSTDWIYYSADNQGKFRIIETKAPDGYFGDWKDDSVTGSDEDKNVYTFVISKDAAENGKTIEISNREDGTFTDQRVKGTLEVTKLDKEGKISKAQGDASLKGAVYELYAAKDIVHQDGTTGILYHKDERITLASDGCQNGVNVYHPDASKDVQIVTSANNMFRIEELELGSYYLKETKASEGYLVDPQKYMAEITYADEKTKTVVVDMPVMERVMKQSLSFSKYMADDTSSVLEPMVGAGFSVYLVSTLENGRYEAMSDEELIQAAIDELRNPTTLLYDTDQKYAPAMVYADDTSADVTEGRLVKKTAYQNGVNYEAEEAHAYYVAELKADEKGVVKVPALAYGRYLVLETATPKGKLATRPFVINVRADENDGVTEGDGKGEKLADKQLTVLIDRSITSLVRILKRDENSKEIVQKEGAAYVIHDTEGAWFHYISKEMTTAQKKNYQNTYGDLVAQYSQGIFYGTREEPLVTKVVKEADGTENTYIETPQPLPSGIYELEEIQAPEGYILQGREGVIDKKEDADGNGTFYETESSGKWKETPKGRVRFIVSNNESVYDETIGSFVTTVRQDNVPAIGKISVFATGEQLTGVKKDKETGDYKFLYGAKPVEGAVFEIRAAEDIYSQEGGKGSIRLLKAGALVERLVTDENGQAWSGQTDWEGTDIAKGLPLGKYTITQTAAGEGFYLSEENREPRQIEIAYAGQEIPVIYKDFTYEIPRQQVKIQVKKTDAKTGEELSGAWFGLYAKEAIKDCNGMTLLGADTLIASAKTTEDDGIVHPAQFAPDLPFGEYYVKELTPPEGYVTNPDVFEITAAYAGETQMFSEVLCKVQDQKTKNSFVKTDLISGLSLSGAKLEIWEVLTDETGKLLKDAAGAYILAQKASAAWTSDKVEEYVVEGLVAGKTYLFRELLAPEGYVGYEASDLVTKRANQDANRIGEEVLFVVQDTEETVKHELKDQRVKGELNITKEGEFLTGIEISVTDRVKDLIRTAFLYMLGRVENVTFGVYVKEDIYTPDGSGEIAEWTDAKGNIVELYANTLLTEVTTDCHGIATVKDLPLGTYFVKEVSMQPEGNLLLSQQIRSLELAYVDQNTPIVYASEVEVMDPAGICYINDRQKVQITVDKYEEENGEKKPLEGAVLGLYTAEDIYGYDVDGEKNVRENVTALLEAHTLIETAESDSDGKVLFSSDLPCGVYYVKEVKAPEGYLKNEEIFTADASYTGTSGDPVLEFHFALSNEKTKIRIQKTDPYTEEGIVGAKLCILEKDSGKKHTEWITDGKEKVIEGLKLSDSEDVIYLLRESAPPEGYVTAKDIAFKLVQAKDEQGNCLDRTQILVSEAGKWKSYEGNLIEMVDEITRIEIRKGDQKTKKLLEGAKLELRNGDGTVLYTWTSSKNQGFEIERLPIGTYRILETEKMDGYKQAAPMVIKVKDTDQTQVFVFENIPEEKKTSASGDQTPQKQTTAWNVQSPKTGDQAPLLLLTAMLLGSLAGLCKTRKRKK